MPALRKIEKPQPVEYAAYASMYVDLTPDDGPILIHLERNAQIVANLYRGLPEERLLYRYAPGKWTMKEVLNHLIDDERIYAYRALRFARNDPTDLPGFDQELFTKHANANKRHLEDMLDEHADVRRASIALFNSFTDEMLLRRGTADGHAVSVRGLIYHLAGHEQHHLNILRDRYLTNV
ncbi:MAG: DinB family protein [Candidatus Acidiferrales bacterium]